MRKRLPRRISFAIAIVVAPCAIGQSFEVASIKPAGQLTTALAKRGPGGPRIGFSGGPGTEDPGLLTCNKCVLSVMMREAYHLQPFQIAPNWKDTLDGFDLSARVPKGTTKEQVRTMLRNLLIERFKLVAHFEEKELQVYDLMIAKSGPKLKESVPDSHPDLGDAKPQLDEDLFVIPLINPHPMMGRIEVGRNNKARIRAADETTQELAERLASAVGKPVRDMTGLTGKYDYSLIFKGGLQVPPADGSSAEGDTGMPIEMAVQAQLGLRLESKKGPVQILVVDHAEKTPTEN